MVVVVGRSVILSKKVKDIEDNESQVSHCRRSIYKHKKEEG